jgi:tetratricopeptide (TPR) repeat protein
MIRNQVEVALALRSSGELQEALKALTTPSDYLTDFYMLRGELQLALDRIEEAAGSYFTVTTAEPQNGLAHYNLGICLHRLEHWEEASQAFQKALDIDPHRDEARLGLGDCFLHLNRVELALSHFDQCWTEAAQSRALMGRAVSLQLLHRFEEAEAAYQRYLSAVPNSEEAVSNLVALSMQSGNRDLARIFAARLLELSPQSRIALQCLAALALEQHNHEAAVRYCGLIVERFPDCMAAWHNLRFASGRVMAERAPDNAAAPGRPKT